MLDHGYAAAGPLSSHEWEIAAAALNMPGPKGVENLKAQWRQEEAETQRAWFEEAVRAYAPLIDTTAWIGTPMPERQWIVPGWLARATGGALFGEDGIGKSLLAQQLVTCVAAGRPFLGMDVTHAGALYLTCEDDALSLRQRQRSINRRLGLHDDAAPAMLSTLVGHNAAELGVFDENGKFVPGPLFYAVRSLMRQRGAGLLVLDNIAHLFVGNEIVRRQVVAFLSGIDALALQCDAAVMLLGHPAKIAGSEYSGNLGWSAHVRQRWFMSYPDASVGDPDARILKKAKANLSKRGEEIAFRWQDWSFVRDEDLPADQRVELGQIAQDARDNAVFLECLAERTRQQRAVSEALSSTYAPKVFESMSESKGIGKKRLIAAMDRLFRLGAIERGLLPWQRDRKPVEGLRQLPE